MKAVTPASALAHRRHGPLPEIQTDVNTEVEGALDVGADCPVPVPVRRQTLRVLRARHVQQVAAAPRHLDINQLIELRNTG